MQKSKGISMISLVVTIVCMILLSSMAIGIGLRYNKETKNRDETAFVEVLSAAVSTRHEETNVDSVNYPYVGYYIKDEEKFDSVFAPKISTKEKFETGIWYVVDNVSADKLGVKKSEDYIEKVEDGKLENVKVALVNYANGETYLINVTANEMKDLDFSNDNKVEGHTHKYAITEPTCTEGVVCTECGFILKEPLGHTYGDSATSAIPVDDQTHFRKECIRCHMQGDNEPHTFSYEFININNAWYHKQTCAVCGWASAVPIACTLAYKLSDNPNEASTSHITVCKVCGHTESEEHTLVYKRITISEHEVTCDKCGHFLRNELHIDDDDNNFCDLCGYEIGDYLPPIIKVCTMINKSATAEDRKYYAKYGDTIEITFESYRPIKDVTVAISGHKVTNVSSSNNDKLWVAEYTIADGSGFSNGKIPFSITCESNSGIAISKAQTDTTDSKYVIFDGNSPIIEYIEKSIRALIGG